MKASETLARRLVDYILDQDLPEGTRLEDEREMAHRLGVGRTTLREALRLLESRGALTIRRGAQGGPVVRRPRVSDLSEAVTLALQFFGVAVDEVFEAREMLEALVTERAAERLSEAQLDELDACTDRLRAGLNDSQTFYRESQLFHRIITEAAGNVVLRVFNETIHAITNDAVANVRQNPKHRQQVLNAHHRVLLALRAGDAKAAAEAMTSHVTQSRNYWGRTAGHLRKAPIRWLLVGHPDSGR